MAKKLIDIIKPEPDDAPMSCLNPAWGGNRPNAGRKTTEGGYTQKLVVMITKDDAELLDELCEMIDQNRSYTIRKIIREAAAGSC